MFEKSVKNLIIKVRLNTTTEEKKRSAKSEPKTERKPDFLPKRSVLRKHKSATGPVGSAIIIPIMMPITNPIAIGFYCSIKRDLRFKK